MEKAPGAHSPGYLQDAASSAGWQIETALVQTGFDVDGLGSLAVPIQPSSTFARRSVAEVPRYGNAREASPTREILERTLAALEHGVAARAFGSGMAAMTAAAMLLKAGDHVLVPHDSYVGTYRLFTCFLPQYGITADFVDFADLEAVERALRPNTRMVWLETPSNPYLRLIDLAAVMRLAAEHGLLSVADNTVASPYCQRPIDFGVDLVVHSTTKYLGGHNDLVGGAVVARTAELGVRLGDQLSMMGAVPSAFDCWLVLRGIKTLAVRMERHMANALALAAWLEQQPQVLAVHYPGLPHHPQQDLVRRQMPGGTGGLLSIEIVGGNQAAARLAESTRLFRFAVSLGSVESLVTVPSALARRDALRYQQTAGSVWAESEGLVRLSVGIENVQDLIADLDQALRAL